MVDFVSTLILVPTLLTYLARETRIAPHEQYLTALLRRGAYFATRRPPVVLAIAAAVVLVALVGITRLRVETNHIGFFARTHPLSRSAAVIDDALAGVYSFNILLEGPADSMNAPDTVRRIDQTGPQPSHGCRR